MSLRIDLRLPCQPEHACRRIEHALGRVSAPPGEIWVLSLQEYDDQEEWLLLATGSVEKRGVEPEWSHVAVERSGCEMICTYARAVHRFERNPELITQIVERLVCTPSIPVAAHLRGRA